MTTGFGIDDDARLEPPLKPPDNQAVMAGFEPPGPPLKEPAPLFGRAGALVFLP